MTEIDPRTRDDPESAMVHAVKIVNEKRLQMIAMNQWPVQEA